MPPFFQKHIIIYYLRLRLGENLTVLTVPYRTRRLFQPKSKPNCSTNKLREVIGWGAYQLVTNLRGNQKDVLSGIYV